MSEQADRKPTPAQARALTSAVQDIARTNGASHKVTGATNEAVLRRIKAYGWVDGERNITESGLRAVKRDDLIAVVKGEQTHIQAIAPQATPAPAAQPTRQRDSHDPCGACGTDTNTAFEAWHWDSPTGSTVVAESCSVKCADKIEALRDRDGVLHPMAVTQLRQIVAPPQAEPPNIDVEIDLAEVVALLLDMGIVAYIENTGGNTATLFAGEEWYDPEIGGGRRMAMLGPGWFTDHKNGRVALAECWVGPDGGSGVEEPLDVRETGAATAAEVAALLAGQVKRSQADVEATGTPGGIMTPDEIKAALGYPAGSPAVEDFAMAIAQLIIEDAEEMLLNIPDPSLPVDTFWHKLHEQVDANEYDIRAAEDAGIEVRAAEPGHMNYVAAAQAFVPAAVAELLANR